MTTSNNPHTLTGLTHNTAYLLQVIARCDDGVTSSPSTLITFTTLVDGINDYALDNTVTVYPNPTTGRVLVQCADNAQSVEVYDAYGKLLHKVNVDGVTADINLAGHAKGTYFLRVTTDKGVVTKRIVKM